MAKMTIKQYMEKRATFAEGVLGMLSGEHEWDADTIDNIGMLAVDLGLGKADRHGYFRRIPNPEAK